MSRPIQALKFGVDAWKCSGLGMSTRAKSHRPSCRRPFQIQGRGREIFSFCSGHACIAKYTRLICRVDSRNEALFGLSASDYHQGARRTNCDAAQTSN